MASSRRRLVVALASWRKVINVVEDASPWFALSSAWLLMASRWSTRLTTRARTEEFIVRAYKGGVKKATHKSTLQYWRRYLSVKQNLPSRHFFDDGSLVDHASASAAAPVPKNPGSTYTYWEARASSEDIEYMWSRPEVAKEWTKSGEKRGKVRFSHDADRRPYLSQVEVKAVAEIVLFKHFSTKGVKPAVLCALADIVSMRFIDGAGIRTGLMGIDYPNALWLYNDLGCRAYMIESVEDLGKPFVSMYFGASYLNWLSEYEGRERSPQFVVQAYLAGPRNVNQETGPLWLKFEEAMTSYGESKREHGSCCIL